MEDWDLPVTNIAEWRQRNRGLGVALSACLALWIVAIILMMQP